MKLSTQCRYASRAALTIAENYNIKPTTRKEISEQEGITEAYLENLLTVLKNSQIVKTVRGSKGGFILAKKPTDITMLDIINAFQGRTDLVECLTSAANCTRSNECITIKVWQELQDAQNKILSSHTLQDLLNDKRTRNKNSNFQI